MIAGLMVLASYLLGPRSPSLAAAAFLAATRYVSLMSVTGTAAAFVTIAVSVAAGWLAPHYLLFAAAAALAIEINHLPNMRRLLRGSEPKLGRGCAPSP